jgi:hypothetical protein
MRLNSKRSAGVRGEKMTGGGCWAKSIYIFLPLLGFTSLNGTSNDLFQTVPEPSALVFARNEVSGSGGREKISVLIGSNWFD